MAVRSPLGARQTIAALLVLTAVTGLVDAVSFLRLGRVFVANMTGNVVFLGFTADRHSGLSPVASLIAIGGFAVGAIAGGQHASRLSPRPARWLGASLSVEAALLAVAALLVGTGVLVPTGDQRYAVILVLAVPLGLQNATVRHLGVSDMTTTVLTQTITGLAADSVFGGGPGAKPLRRGGSALAMLAGAAAGAALVTASVAAVIALAAGLVAVVAVAFGVGAAAAPAPSEIADAGGPVRR